MGEARFVFVSDRVDDSVERTQPEHWVWWRLVAANNRVLGRSTDTYLGEDTCRAAAAQLCKHVAEAVQLLTIDGRGRWTWTLSLDDTPCAESAHPFPRRVDCVRTLSLLLDGLRVADPHAGTLRVYAAGRNRVHVPIPNFPADPLSVMS